MQYKYLPADLPIRVWESLSRFCKEEEYEVSTLLCAAWAVFVVPTERLNLIEQSRPHPAGEAAMEDGVQSLIVEQWREKKNQRVMGLSQGEGLYSDVPLNVRDMNPDSREWIHAITQSPVNQCPCYGDFTKTMRNGLSHGNIWTGGKTQFIDMLYIANYPLSENQSPSVVAIRPESLLVVVDEFVEWYKDCAKSDTAEDQIGLTTVLSE
jgi:hypothetical protein